MTQLTKTDLQQMKVGSTTSMPAALVKFANEIVLPASIDKTKFLLSARTIFTRVRDIQKCDPGSVVGALVQTAVLGLDPNPDLGLVYYVPRTNRNTNTTELEFKLGYRGLKEIVLRNKEITLVDTEIVYENDVFKVVKFGNPPIVHEPNYKDRGKPYAVYAVAKFRGEFIFEVLTEKDVMDAKNRSDAKTSNYSPWNAPEESVRLEMWKKTAFRRLCKLLPLSATKGTEIDDAVIPEKAIQTGGDVAEVDYTEVVPNVEYTDAPAVDELPQATPEQVQEQADTKAKVQEAAQEKTLNMTDKHIDRIKNGEIVSNCKIYKGGQFGSIYVKAKDASYSDKGVRLYIQTAEQAARIEELASQKEPKKPANEPAPDNNDPLPF